MYFSLVKRNKEITNKAKELNGYYTAEFSSGYMMTHYPKEFLLDIIITGSIFIVPASIFLFFIIHK